MGVIHMYSGIRAALVRTIVAASFLSAATIIRAQSVTTEFDLPNQPLAESLRAVASRTDSNILFDKELVGRVSVKPLNGQMSIDEALNRLLAGTGLTYRKSDDKTVVIMPDRDRNRRPSSKQGKRAE
jgi:outer membrane receptor for ferric coprogen and ferric-rhodotorulic acid